MFAPTEQHTSDTSWPQPPSFDKNAPIQYPHKFEPTYLMKRLRGKKVTPEDVPAPLKVRQGGTPDIDILTQNVQKQNKEYSNNNPFLLDATANPFSPPSPTFFADPNDNSDEKKVPRPCIVPKPKQKWNSLSLEEQKTIYYDTKEEFMEYMNDTFPLRLDFVIEEKCEDTFKAYERCLDLKKSRWGGYRWSSARAGLAQMYLCPQYHHAYSKCLDSVNRREQEAKLKDNDFQTLNRLFPR
eukprot:256945_1